MLSLTLCSIAKGKEQEECRGAPCEQIRSSSIPLLVCKIRCYINICGEMDGWVVVSFAAFLQTATQQSGYRCLQDMARDLMDIKRKHRDIKGVFCVNEPMPFRLTGSAWMI